MPQATMCDGFECDGSSALKVSRRDLTLLDGYVTPVPEVPSRACVNRLSLGQLVASFVAGAAVVLMLCAVSFFTSDGISAREGQALETTPATSITVHGGDSLWSLPRSIPRWGIPPRRLSPGSRLVTLSIPPTYRRARPSSFPRRLQRPKTCLSDSTTFHSWDECQCMSLL